MILVMIENKVIGVFTDKYKAHKQFNSILNEIPDNIFVSLLEVQNNIIKVILLSEAKILSKQKGRLCI